MFLHLSGSCSYDRNSTFKYIVYGSISAAASPRITVMPCACHQFVPNHFKCIAIFGEYFVWFRRVALAIPRSSLTSSFALSLTSVSEPRRLLRHQWQVIWQETGVSTDSPLYLYMHIYIYIFVYLNQHTTRRQNICNKTYQIKFQGRDSPAGQYTRNQRTRHVLENLCAGRVVKCAGAQCECPLVASALDQTHLKRSERRRLDSFIYGFVIHWFPHRVLFVHCLHFNVLHSQ